MPLGMLQGFGSKDIVLRPSDHAMGAWGTRGWCGVGGESTVESKGGEIKVAWVGISDELALGDEGKVEGG
ncbi:hypothetical protein SLEP1_g37237 [Rubroshorea leprosula]|uniref:Uncharacterized protein n=1 Tax=Rubroshorea leprosula TaxID=152421 RepID=A0AAV5KU12_9ROSI|nr:hypothetical protein SLEP1_g37237 [Rubroshorea leprosula]